MNILNDLNDLNIYSVYINKPEMFDRIEYYSRIFLGRPYLGGAQGEGPGAKYDTSPLYRFDCFDCVTYVNNVLALAFSNNDDSFIKNLLRLNYYDAEPLFEKRFHFMSCDWNIQNQKNGFVKDITKKICDEVGEALAVSASGEIDKPNWYRCQNKLVPDGVQKELCHISYVPIHCFFDVSGNIKSQLFDQIPPGVIIEIVRPNWDLVDTIGTKLHVSHLGFAIRKQSGELYFRHASSEKKSVVEVLLADYLRNCLSSQTIKGINLQMPINQK